MAAVKTPPTPNRIQLISSDNPGIPLVASTLNGDNYRTRARPMRTALRQKMKLGFIDDSIKKPDLEPADYLSWDKADSTVLAWILNSVGPRLHASILHATTAREIWEDL